MNFLLPTTAEFFKIFKKFTQKIQLEFFEISLSERNKKFKQKIHYLAAIFAVLF